jgi:hypothetical protein
MKTIDVVLSHILDDSMRELHASVSTNARFMIYARLQRSIDNRLFNTNLENQMAEDINKK